VRLVLVQPALRFDGDNLDRLRRAIDDVGAQLTTEDIVLLPEHWDLDDDAEGHLGRVTALARSLGCHVIGGSHHGRRGNGHVNTGHVVAPDGTVMATYDKLRPYASERLRVEPGEHFGEVVIGGRRVLVLICADFWFSDLFDRAETLPDLVCVPALSVTRKPHPDYSRSLWRHLAIARAYELGIYVGVSDWGAHSELPVLRTSGVAGFADPTGVDPDAFFTAVGGDARIYDVDFDALMAFRQDRRARGFFWR
jgi:predicted amidohydrolase